MRPGPLSCCGFGGRFDVAGTERNTGQHWMFTLQRNKTMTIVPFKLKCLNKVLPSFFNLIEFFCY